MAVTVRTTSNNGADPNGLLPLAANDILYVLPNVQLTNSNTSANASAVSFSGNGTIFNQGLLLGATFGIFAGGVSAANEIVSVAAGGSVVGLAGISTNNAAANWTVNVDRGGTVSGATDGFDFLGAASVSVLGTISGASSNGVSDLGSAAKGNSLSVGTGGAVTGGTTGLSGANALATWNIAVAAGGQIIGGTDGVNLTGAGVVSIAGTVSGTNRDGIKGPTAGSLTETLTVASGGSLSGGFRGIESTAAGVSWRLMVAAGGSIAGGTDGVSVAGGGVFTVLGQITSARSNGLVAGGATAASVEVYVGAGGSIAGGQGNGLTSSSSRHAIENHGQIKGSGSGNGVETHGVGSLVNFGSIGGNRGAGNNFWAISNQDTVATDVVTTVNYGVISGDHAYNGGPSVDRVYNFGVMNGDVFLGDGIGSLFDSTQGSVNGLVICGVGGDTVVAGNTGGSVLGDAGNDVLYASQSQTAVDNAAQTTLNGRSGANALYGDGAFTTFLAGTASGGTNQIWGQISQMAGVSGYANNTVSFASSVSHGVYVDLLNGHNAFISTGTNWTGSGVFEDWIAASGSGLSSVPNVIGSSWADALLCDAGIDRFTGGGGADALYAGTGASSRDTFDYNAYADSNLTNGYDTIVGFKIGVDKIDVSGFMQANGLGPTSLAIFTNGTSNTVYIEKTPGTVNAATDLAMIVNTSAAGGLHASDFIF